MAMLLDWRNPGGPDALQPAVDALRSGGLAVLPTDSGYACVGDARCRAALDQVARAVNLTPPSEFANHELSAMAVGNVKRILNRCWPGLLGVRLSGRSGAEIRVRQPRHSAIDALIAAVSFPLLIAEPTQRDGSEETA